MIIKNAYLRFKPVVKTTNELQFSFVEMSDEVWLDVFGCYIVEDEI